MFRLSRKVLCLILCIVTSVVLLLNNGFADERNELKEGDVIGSYKARIKVDYAAIERNISPLLFGNNSKLLFGGEASFGRDNGIWSKQDNDINKNIRDWLVDSGITILRYGDGGNAEYFYWGWSVLPFERRIATPVRNRWSGSDHYIFGIMEFIKICETVKCEGIIIVNYNMGFLKSFYDPQKNNDTRSKREISAQQAANWVEFMNIPAPVKRNSSFPEKYKPEYSLQKMPKGYFAYLRARLGHPNPVGIKYWEIGNETDHFYELEEYIRGAIEYSRAMKAVDPSIKIGWVDYGKIDELKLATQVPDAVDFLIPHDYVILKDKKRKFLFYGSQIVKRQINVHKGGEYLVRFNAFARAYFGTKYPEERAVPPRMELKVDDRVIKEIIINKNIKQDKSDLIFNSYWYEIPVTLSPGTHTVSLQMTNDFFDKSETDVNRRGRDIFVHSWLVEGEGEKYNILFSKDNKSKLPAPYAYYSLITGFNKRLSNRQALISKYAPWLFVAQTESGYWPPTGTIWGALGEAMMIMADMKYGVTIRNYWQLYGNCRRAGVIHSGTQNQDNYHLAPEYYVNKMFSQHFGSKMLSSSVKFPKTYLDDTGYVNDEEISSTKSLHCPLQSCIRTLASRDSNRLYIAIVNLHTSKNVIVEVNIQNFQAEKTVQYILRAKNPKEFNATNEKIKNNVFIQTIRKDKPVKNISLLPNSFTIIEFSKDVSGKVQFY